MKEKIGIRFTTNLNKLLCIGFQVKNIGLGLGCDGLFLIRIRSGETKRSGFTITTLLNPFNRRRRDIFYPCLQVVQRRFLPSLPHHYPDLQHGSACRLLQSIWLGYVHRESKIESTKAPVVFFILFGWGTSIERVRQRALRHLSSSSIYLAGVRPQRE